ncbi:RND transporter [Desulfosediminicola flagellatus]|uniref:RND transporter n=1 Tax=Desulfosediminicola flagellatus TaxID=2569541 RepID=UPI0010ACA870|nr:RND transporter [Desulfosediminicola flagellatus]
MSWLDKIPFSVLVILSLTLGLAPFTPAPHLIEKLGMLVSGNLNKSIDIFDLVMHASPMALLVMKMGRSSVR